MQSSFGPGQPKVSDSEVQELLTMLQNVQKSGVDPSTLPGPIQELLAAVNQGGPMGPTSPSPGIHLPQPDQDRIEIFPEPFYVVKTVDDTGRKVFINMCGHEDVPPPGSWEGGKPPPELQQALENLGGEMEAGQVEALRFPASIGDPHNDLDKGGKPCSVFDVVFNKDVIKQSTGATQVQLKVFLIEMALGQIGKKHGLILDAKFKLPKMKYKGPEGSESVRAQCIRRPASKRDDPSAPSRPKISELASTDLEEPAIPLRIATPAAASKPAPKGASKANATAATKGPVASDRVDATAPRGGSSLAGPRGLLDLPPPSFAFEGRPVHAFTATWTLPSDLARDLDPASVDLEIRSAPAQVAVGVPGCRSAVCPLPFHASPDASSADLHVDEGTGRVELRVRLEYLPVEAVMEDMKGRAPHSLGSLQLSSLSLVDELA